MTTTENIHGHEILRLVSQTHPPLTRVALLQAAENRFGVAARFCTCSAADMTLPELLEFLLSRGKLVERDGCLYADLDRMCGDGGH